MTVTMVPVGGPPWRAGRPGSFPYPDHQLDTGPPATWRRPGPPRRTLQPILNFYGLWYRIHACRPNIKIKNRIICDEDKDDIKMRLFKGATTNSR
jgi:hypothetical protein